MGGKLNDLSLLMSSLKDFLHSRVLHVPGLRLFEDESHLAERFNHLARLCSEISWRIDHL